MDSRDIMFMFKKIVKNKNAFFRSQQKNEPDLTEIEKLEIVKNLYQDKPAVFLSRYADFLSREDVEWFKSLNIPLNSSTAEEIDYYVGKLENSTEKTLKNKIKNRRFAYLKKILEKSDYFSDYEMRNRQPLLYDKMIGKYQNENEMRMAFHPSQDRATWSSVLFDLYDSKMMSDKKDQEKTAEKLENLQFYNNSDESEESEMEDDSEPNKRLAISQEDKDHFRNVFLHEMYEKFLNGEDVTFDYSLIDTNQEYDLIDLVENDEQEKYFDKD